MLSQNTHATLLLNNTRFVSVAMPNDTATLLQKTVTLPEFGIMYSYEKSRVESYMVMNTRDI
jgi:hypothetical protein